MKQIYDYPAPKEGEFLKIKLDPNGLHDVIDSFEFDSCGADNVQHLIEARLRSLRKQNLAKGFKDGFKPTFSIVQFKKPKAPCDH